MIGTQNRTISKTKTFCGSAMVVWTFLFMMGGQMKVNGIKVHLILFLMLTSALAGKIEPHQHIHMVL